MTLLSGQGKKKKVLTNILKSLPYKYIKVHIYTYLYTYVNVYYTNTYECEVN